MSAGTQTAPTDAKIFASEETNRLKGFMGTAEEMTSVATVVAPHSVDWVKSLSDDELFPLGEKALHDIADDILVLDEIRQRFRLRGSMRGYSNWKDFVEKNSRYSVRTIQNRLAEKNGKDESKVNHKTGNMYTRDVTGPSDDSHGQDSVSRCVCPLGASTLRVISYQPCVSADGSEGLSYFHRIQRC